MRFHRVQYLIQPTSCQPCNKEKTGPRVLLRVLNRVLLGYPWLHQASIVPNHAQDTRANPRAHHSSIHRIF